MSFQLPIIGWLARLKSYGKVWHGAIARRDELEVKFCQDLVVPDNDNPVQWHHLLCDSRDVWRQGVPVQVYPACKAGTFFSPSAQWEAMLLEDCT